MLTSAKCLEPSSSRLPIRLTRLISDLCNLQRRYEQTRRRIPQLQARDHTAAACPHGRSPMSGKTAADVSCAAGDEDGVAREMHGCLLLHDVDAGQPSTAGFRTSSHHWRKLVGVVLSGVRGSALSRPSFLAAYMAA